MIIRNYKMIKIKNDKLPKYGFGPLYFIISFIMTILSLLYFNNIHIFQSGIINNYFLRKLFLFFSILSIILGVLLWCFAVFPSKGIRYKLEKGELETEGVYSISRNPIYSGIYFILLGIQMLTCNIFVFIIAIIIYIFLSILIIKTEEKWCLKKFGKKYEEYCNQDNRIIPWFPKRKKTK